MSSRFLHSGLLFTLLLWASGVFAQQASLEVKLDTGLIAIGEQIQLTLDIRAPKDARVEWPEWKDTLVGKIEILEASNPDTVYNAGLKTVTQQLTLTGFDSGLFVVPPVVAFVDDIAVKSRPFLIQVVTYQIDTIKGINDIKRVQEADFGWRDALEVFWPVGVALVGLGVIGFIMVWLGRHRKRKVVVKEKPKVIPHAHALRRLEELQQQQLWQSGQVKEYHASFSEIIREYIENQFGILALEQTTDEIMQQLRVVNIDPLLKEELQRQLMLSDLVKFAKHLPLPVENERILRFSFQFVEQTIPNEKEEEKVAEPESEGGKS
ncbi:hypothetical protein KFE98_19245 [bacterium SCSIO 12741]|nr:hypothetical protein KFE98_19245 [bacterium SCSIO 12741]